jgi:cyclophilin family peptidyl-prolyl cis-trans isomerase
MLCVTRLISGVRWFVLLSSAVSAPAGAQEVSSALSELIDIVSHEDRRDTGEELLRHLDHADASVRARAALAVGRIGRAADAGAVARLLEDPDVSVRRMAAFALGEIPDSASAVPLWNLLTAGEEPDSLVREYAVEGLGKHRSGADACRRALDDPAENVRARALLAAWQIPVPSVVDRATEFSSDGRAEIRRAATHCLMRLVGAPPSGRTAVASAPPLSPAERESVGRTLLARLGDPDAGVRMQAARGLRSFGEDPMTEALLGLQRDSDWRVRVEAVRALGAEPGAATTPAGAGARPRREIRVAEIEPLLGDPQPNVRIEAVSALARIGAATEAVPRLLASLENPEPRFRQVAFESLLQRWRSTGDPPPADVLERIERTSWTLLYDRDWSVRALAAEGAALLPGDRAFPILTRVVEDDDGRAAKLGVEPYLRAIVDRGSGTLWNRLGPPLADFMAGEDPMVSLAAVAAVGEIVRTDTVHVPASEDWQSFEAFLFRTYDAALQVKSAGDLRETVVGVAAELPDRPALRPLLERACGDPSYIVRRAAVAALQAVGDDPPRAAEPVETGRSESDYRRILEWASRPHWAVLETDGGTIVARLFASDAPLTAWNFASLAAGGFYDDGVWHRVVPDFVLQDGCPRGDGWGGPDWQIRCEINPHRFRTGTLGMALSGKDTGGSQFFITHSDQPHLDGGYTVFGQIEGGQAVADAVVQGARLRSVRVVERP